MMVTEGLADADCDPEPERIYAIGDVHGQSDQLLALHEAIRRDRAANPVASTLVVHLGDYIDRGPNSARCLGAVLAAERWDLGPVVNLMGNHERMLLDALDDPGCAETWLTNGGTATLQSWGIDADAPSERWAEQIPPAQLDLIRGLALHHEAGDYVFVHAGVRPGIRLAMQSEDDLLWIRDEFLNWGGTMLPDRPGARIVHGHTPSEQPEDRRNRIGIDTNAARGGKLTCAALSKDSVYFLQV